MQRIAGFSILFLFLIAPAWAQTTYSFGVVPQRSATLTAQYWNPILDYISSKSGIKLELVTKKSAQEFSEAEARGEFDFVHNNHIFAPSHIAAAYRVIARPAGESIRSQIVVLAASPVRSLRELEGKEVGFANKNGFTGYAAPMSALIQAGVSVKPTFGGNQEGVMAQLRAGTIPAAGVNSRVMQEYAARENVDYRALWTSEPFLDLPVAVHPRVSAKVVTAVRDAFVGMASNEEGLQILKSSAAIIKQQASILGFVLAQDAGYKNQREVYSIIWKKEAR
jgi:phosphonate transport system substrate-binding protein